MIEVDKKASQDLSISASCKISDFIPILFKKLDQFIHEENNPVLT